MYMSHMSCKNFRFFLFCNCELFVDMMKEIWIDCDGKKIHPELVSFTGEHSIQIVFLSEKRPDFELQDKIKSSLKTVKDLKCSSSVPKNYFSDITNVEIAFTQKSFDG